MPAPQTPYEAVLHAARDVAKLDCALDAEMLGTALLGSVYAVAENDRAATTQNAKPSAIVSALPPMTATELPTRPSRRTGAASASAAATSFMTVRVRLRTVAAPPARRPPAFAQAPVHRASRCS